MIVQPLDSTERDIVAMIGLEANKNLYQQVLENPNHPASPYKFSCGLKDFRQELKNTLISLFQTQAIHPSYIPSIRELQTSQFQVLFFSF